MEITIDWNLIGRRIKAARERSGMTQEVLGDEICVSESYVSKIERGKTIVSLYRLYTIAVLLEVPPCDLLLGCCPDVKTEHDKPSSSPDKEHMYQLIDRASPTLLKAMCSICDTLMSTVDSRK